MTESLSPVRPYALAVPAHGLLFLSGQVALSPETGKLIEGDFGAQLWQALSNMAAVLQAHDLGLEHLVKVTVFLTRTEDYATMNELYIRFFKVNFPARTTLIVKGLPLGAIVEVEAIASHS